MNNTIVIYESKYGYTKQYAKWIAEALSCPLFEKKSVSKTDLQKADTIIYGGGLYAGGINGIKLIISDWNLISDKKVAVFTCGLAAPEEPTVAVHLKEAIHKTFSPEMCKKITFFHLRGGMDYSRLTPIHRAMMAMLRKMLLKKDPSELDASDIGILETYGQTLDFTDKSTIQGIIDWAK